MSRLTNVERILISRTDSIGDVVLTLPLAGLLKELLPNIEIVFLGKNYTAPLLSQCEHIDQVLPMEELLMGDATTQTKVLKHLQIDAFLHVFPRKELALLAHKAGIRYRIGSTGRLYHYLHCNMLVPLSRRRSPRHEAELNTFLLKPFGLDAIPDADSLSAYYGLNAAKVAIHNPIEIKHPAVILHPGSKGSAREWKLEHFASLSQMLGQFGYHVYLTGTEEEGKIFRPFLCKETFKPHDLSGQLKLEELIGFIASADAMVAASTGPLHIAAALGKLAIGIYPPIRPMHPARWRPLGAKAHFLVKEMECNDCRKKPICHCMQAVEPLEVFNLIKRELSILM